MAKKRHRDWKEEIKLFLFIDNMVVKVGKPKEPTHKTNQ